MRKRNSTINQITLIGKTLKREHQFANGNVRLICSMTSTLARAAVVIIYIFLVLLPLLFLPLQILLVLQVNYPPILGASLYLATPPA